MMKTGLRLTRDEIDRKKRRNWKEWGMEKSKCGVRDGLVVAHFTGSLSVL